MGRIIALLVSCFCLLLGACNLPQSQENQTAVPEAEITVSQSPLPTETPEPPGHLNICLTKEPDSLFIYGDYSSEAALVRQAIYDGPFDWVQGELIPVILEKIPRQVDGDVFFEQVQVQPGAVLVDAWGKLVNLTQDVSYFPAGCQDFSCVQAATGDETILVDQQVIRFSLKKGIKWSDNTELSADDSLYAFELARDLFPKAGLDTMPYTSSYLVVDATTLEWRGMPGFQSGDYQKFFFHPLPRHAWGDLPLEELLTSEKTSRMPLGWGPFVIDEWRPGIEIRLSKNPAYFRSQEGLPEVDQLTFRFITSREDAIAALSTGDCDLLSPSFNLAENAEQLRALEQNPELKLEVFSIPEWEHLDFGIASLNNEFLPLFESKLTRQAMAMCLDRETIISGIASTTADIPNTFLPVSHPRYHAGVRSYAYDPDTAGVLLDSAGWLDADADEATARIAQGIAGIEDGTPLSFTLWTTPDEERLRIAESIQENLAGCGVQVQIEAIPPEQLFLPGPEGKLFGRQFQSAQFAWAGNTWPACSLFTSLEIPGDYPQFLKGWGGANLTGYSNHEYDQACILSQRALPGTPEYENSQAYVQSIFSEDLPVIPLFFRQALTASTVNLCEPLVDQFSGFTLWNIEKLSLNHDCLD